MCWMLRGWDWWFQVKTCRHWLRCINLRFPAVPGTKSGWTPIFELLPFIHRAYMYDYAHLCIYIYLFIYLDTWVCTRICMYTLHACILKTIYAVHIQHSHDCGWKWDIPASWWSKNGEDTWTSWTTHEHDNQTLNFGVFPFDYQMRKPYPFVCFQQELPISEMESQLDTRRWHP